MYIPCAENFNFSFKKSAFRLIRENKQIMAVRESKKPIEYNHLLRERNKKKKKKKLTCIKKKIINAHSVKYLFSKAWIQSIRYFKILGISCSFKLQKTN